MGKTNSPPSFPMEAVVRGLRWTASEIWWGDTSRGSDHSVHSAFEEGKSSALRFEVCRFVGVQMNFSELWRRQS